MCQNWRTRKRKHLFCSSKCSGEYVSKNNKNVVACEVCGKIVKKKPQDIRKQKHFCCSYECMAELRKKIYLGEDNPNYGNRGEKNPMWTGDKKISNYGYILIRCEHPNKNCDGFVFGHRLVAEKYLLTEENSYTVGGKRYLKKEYDAHHIDANKKNNDVSNLLVLTRSEHMKLHVRARMSKS